ncbi:anionic trypsin-2-like [Pempheris klunzingeri]|uniref:anionic trypsin-2-like n=1 Tax=Pempheris klunzingeri TaxID=3127111 RepID=UPI00397FEC80
MGGMTGLLLLLWVGATMSAVVDLQKRIIGGHTCANTDRLYHVQLQYSNGGLLCGGSLISDQWILTAAHCLKVNMKAVVGVHPVDNKQKRTVGIQKSVIYPDSSQSHDIMLLKLNERIVGITPIKPPTDTDCNNLPKKKAPVQFAGHGPTASGSTQASATLQCIDLTVDDCPGLKHLTYDNYYAKLLCGRTSGQVACPGDSGGGAVHGGIIYGVFSRPTDCTQEPLFMDVCYYLKWITDEIKK